LRTTVLNSPRKLKLSTLSSFLSYKFQAETKPKQDDGANANESAKKKNPDAGRLVLEDALKMLASNQNVPLGDAEALPNDDDLGDFQIFQRESSILKVLRYQTI
jgi:hypothetical protein